MTEESEQQLEQKRLREAYARTIVSWNTVFKTVAMYTPDHPSAMEAARKMAIVLEEVLQKRFEVTIQHSEALFTAEDFFFIEESLMFYDLLRQMEKRKIPGVIFLPGVAAPELIQLGAHLQAKSNEAAFSSPHIRVMAEGESADATTELASRGVQPAIERTTKLYDEWLGIGEQIFSKLLDEQTLIGAEVSLRLDQLIDSVNQNPPAWASVLATKKDAAVNIRHSIDSMVLAIFIGLQLNYDTTTVKSLAIAALLHDIGRFLLPADFKTDYAVSPDDVPFVQLHSRDGASFLAGVAGLPMSVVRCALEHHIGVDRQGYPALPSNHDLHFFSKIIALVDFVSWGTVSDSTYHRPVALHRRLRSMIRRSRTQFDPLLVKVLVPFFGVYPPGTRVRLSSGQPAVVMLPDARNIVRPTVAIHLGAGRWSFQSLASPAGDKDLSIASAFGSSPEFSQLLPHLTVSVA